jgi:GNAT superfamily N-acetyltransferase
MAVKIKEISARKMIDLMNDKLAEAHWDEVRTADAALNIDVEQHLEMERTGFLKAIGAFDEDNLVGYLVVVTVPVQHISGEYELLTNTFYVDPEYRNSGVFKSLLGYAEGLCRRYGIRWLSVAPSMRFEHVSEFEEFLRKNSFAHTYSTYTREVLIDDVEEE